MTKTDNEDKKTRIGFNGKINIYTVVYMFIWIITEVLILKKCRIGYVSYDESLYLTIPYRFVQGDAMIVEEWNLSQLSFFAVIPYVYGFFKLIGSSEGIFFAYRCLYAIIWGAAAAFFYIRLNKYSHAGAILASAIFQIYAPYGIMALSYNTMAILAIALAATVMLPIGGRVYLWQDFAGGLLFAYSVLCCPYVLIIWVAGFVYSLVRKNVRAFIAFTGGAAALAFLLAVFILSRASVPDIVRSVPIMLDDPYHQPVSIFGYIKDYAIQLVFGIPHGVVIYGCLLLLIVCIIADKKAKKRKTIYFLAAVILTSAILVEFILYNKYINFFMYPVSLLAFICYILSDDDKIRQLFLYYWVPGAMYSFCINMASNQYLRAITSGYCVAMIGSVIIIAIFVRGMEKERKLIAAGAAAVILLTLIPEAYLRYSFVFWDNEVWEEAGLITAGPMKGILASCDKVDEYNELYKEVSGRIHGNRRVLLFMRDNWPYLLDGIRCSAYSPWLQNEIDDYSVDRLIKYYEIDETRQPEVIFTNKKYMTYADKLTNELKYKGEQYVR